MLWRPPGHPAPVSARHPSFKSRTDGGWRPQQVGEAVLQNGVLGFIREHGTSTMIISWLRLGGLVSPLRRFSPTLSHYEVHPAIASPPTSTIQPKQQSETTSDLLRPHSMRGKLTKDPHCVIARHTATWPHQQLTRRLFIHGISRHPSPCPMGRRPRQPKEGGKQSDRRPIKRDSECVMAQQYTGTHPPRPFASPSRKGGIHPWFVSPSQSADACIAMSQRHPSPRACHP